MLPSASFVFSNNHLNLELTKHQQTKALIRKIIPLLTKRNRHLHTSECLQKASSHAAQAGPAILQGNTHMSEKGVYPKS